MVEPRADPVHHGGDVLAHRRVVRAAARELDRRRRREQAFLIGAQPGHHGVRQPAAQQIDARADTAGAVALERAPGRGRDRGDLDRDVVEARSADLCGDRPGLDLQIDHRATAQVAAAAVEPVREVLVSLEVGAPRLAPERLRDLLAREHDGRHRLALARRVADRARGVGAALGD